MLVDLYEKLDKKRQYRDRLATYLILFGGLIMLLAGLPARAWRVGGGSGFYVALGIITLVFGVIGLWLLVQFVTNAREIRELREEIGFVRATRPHEDPKRKRTERVRFVIGDDGELVQADLNSDDDFERIRRRIVL